MTTQNNSDNEGEAMLPQTTYKNKRAASDDERFRLNSELNTYLFNNCDHEHDGYSNHLACRPCVLDCLAVIASRASVAAPEGDRNRQVSELLQALETDIRLLAEPQPTTTATRLMVARDYAMGHLAVLRELLAAASAPLPAEPPQPHYFVPIETSEKCGYAGCNLDVLAHPETPKHNFPATPLQPEGEQDDYDYKAGWHNLLRQRNEWLGWARAMLKRGDPTWEHLPEGDAQRKRLTAMLTIGAPPAAPVVAEWAMQAARELERHLNPWWLDRDRLGQVAAIISKHFAPADELVDEVQRRMDQVVEAAVEWHQAGREGGEWFDAAEKLSAAINSLLELRDKPALGKEPI